MKRTVPIPLVIVSVLFLSLVTSAQAQPAGRPNRADAVGPPALAEAEAFMKNAESVIDDLTTKSGRASWVQETYITEDTEVMTAEANDKLIEATTRFIHDATRFDPLLPTMPQALARKFRLLKLSLTMPAPSDPAERQKLTRVASGLDANYGRGKYCPKSGPYAGKCLGQSEMEKAFEVTRDPQVLLELWTGWHSISPSLRQPYTQLIELSNKGAREIGFKDVGALWRSNYDMPPDAFTTEAHRLWEQVRPLYESLHAYVRHRLVEKYGSDVVPPTGMIPAHLLGNIWGQEWGGIYDLVAPPQEKKSYDVTDLLKAKNTQPLDMVHYGEKFFMSLGFPPLPKTFWERSLFVKPADRDVVCHASAWDIDNVNDLRLKMCIQVRGEDFTTIHHELGHNFYQRAYNTQPFLFRGGANDGFHEAIGDAIALSITPEYLHEVGLLAAVPPQSQTAGDIPFLLRQGMDKIAFLPFGMMIDEWRWRVFSGEITPANYNKGWWDLRQKYEGIAPPVARSEADFDPGAKYHVPGNVPYVRYFLARILQFQFYRGMCRAAGHTGPLYRCTFFNNKQAGARLDAMLKLGQSRPWPEALKALTDEDHMDAGAMMEYFAPLKQWLDEQNKGQKVGW